MLQLLPHYSEERGLQYVRKQASAKPPKEETSLQNKRGELQVRGGGGGGEMEGFERGRGMIWGGEEERRARAKEGEMEGHGR